MISHKMSPYYVVFKGKNPGVYLTWHECSEQVLGFKNVIYMKCSNYEQAVTDFNASTGALTTSPELFQTETCATMQPVHGKIVS